MTTSVRSLLVRLGDWLPVTRGRYRRQRQDADSSLADCKARAAELGERLSSASDCLLSLPAPATSAALTVVIPPAVATATEICLFVCHAVLPTLKLHVREHIRALADEGIAVILVINSEVSSDQLALDVELAASLSGCLVRENSGYDFAAWAHAFTLEYIGQHCRRLYMVNDSVVGPLDADAYADLIRRIRGSTADLVGLTENLLPRPHLQSYFLVAGEALLHSATFRRLLQSIVNLPAKQDVIDHYETQLTRFLRAAGFRCEALFLRISCDPLLTDDTVYCWAELIESGFPFIKARVLDGVRDSPEAVRLIPERYRARPA